MTETNNKAKKVLSVKDLVISFKTDKGTVHAVRGVSFDLYKGETLCIVGESGSGKSVTNKAVMGISANNAIIENGSIMYRGEDLLRISEEEFHRIRGHEIGMIFQDPLSALNPVVRIGKQITEATLINKNILKKHFHELFSKELIAFRNADANRNFSLNKIKNEIKDLKTSFALYKKYLKKNNEEEREKIYLKLSKYFADLKTFTKSESDRLVLEAQKLQDKISKGGEDETNLIQKIHLENLQSVMAFNESLKYDELNKDNLESLISERITSLKEEKLLTENNFKKVGPLLKEVLKTKKDQAKKETAIYAASLKIAYEDNLHALETSLKAEENKRALRLSSLSEEKQNLIKKEIRENKLIKSQMAKLAFKQQELNISKTSQKSDLKLKEYSDPKYQELTLKIIELKKEIAKVKEEYINKTKVTKAEAKKMALKVMREVGIAMPERRFKQYPFEFSGGMRQRIVIAIALTADPDILICDEPTTALDVTIQAQILELINRLKAERNLSCIFITHDLGVVANMADRVAVMYAGKIVEYGKAEEIFFDPRHPYTWALLSSIPDVDSKEKLEAIPGTPPDMRYPPKGDAFALRSKYALAIDFKHEPPFFKVSDTHFAATWLLYDGAPKVEMPLIVKTRINNALKEHARMNKENQNEKR